MIHEIAYTLVFGRPIIMYGGLITYFSLLTTASIALLNVKFGVHVIPFKWHPRFAFVTILFATMHAILGLSAYFNF